MNFQRRHSWLKKLTRIGLLAEGSKFRRWWHSPWRYTLGQAWAKGVYPVSKRVWKTNTRLFFGDDFVVTLPAGLDLYLLGAKSHDSEIRLAKFFIRHIREGQTIIDVGAHLGYFTMLAGKLVGPSGQVMAFEASPIMFEYLKENIDDTPSISAANQGMASQKGEMIFYEFPMMYSEFNSLNSSQYQGAKWYAGAKPREITIQTTCLDEYTRESKKNPAFIKIDVEGAEEAVIIGASSLLTQAKPVVIMEFIEKMNATETQSAHQKAANLLRIAGYEAFLITKDGLVEKMDTSDWLISGRESDNLVFIHPQNPLVPCVSD